MPRFVKLKKKIKLSVDRKQNKEIKKLKKVVKTLSKTNEKKWKDDAIVSADVNSHAIGSYQLDLTNIYPWDSDAAAANATRNYSRIGNSVVVTRIQLNGQIVLPEGGTDPTYACRVRFLVVYTPDSEYAGLGEILEHPNDIDSHKKIKPDAPYRILYDKKMNLQNTVPSAISGGTRNATAVEPFRRNISIQLGPKKLGKGGLKVSWAQGSASDQPMMGAITLYAISDVIGTFTAPVFGGRRRLRFLDN